jgi:hypothetical protein
MLGRPSALVAASGRPMPLEFALRPRIRLSEGFAPPRRSRLRVPKLALPILAYWLVVAGITYELIHAHDTPEEATEQAAVAPAPTSTQPWWQKALAGDPLAPIPSAPQALATALPATGSEPPPVPLPSTAPLAPVEPTNSQDFPAAEAPPLDDAAEAPSAPIPREQPSPTRASHPLARHQARDPDMAVAAPVLAREPAEAPAFTPPDAPAREEPHRAGSLPGCEAAAASANEELDLSHRAVTPDLPRESIAMVLDNGAWLSGCAIPDSTSIDVCVAITSGNVIGATVVARPANSSLSACIKRRAAGLLFPYSSRLDIARTHFDGH